MVKLDQALRRRPTLTGIAVKKRRIGTSRKYGNQLPPQVERVPHGDIHPLTCLRAVGMASIPRQHHTRVARCDLVFRHVVELVCQSVPDLVN